MGERGGAKYTDKTGKELTIFTVNTYQRWFGMICNCLHVEQLRRETLLGSLSLVFCYNVTAVSNRGAIVKRKIRYRVVNSYIFLFVTTTLVEKTQSGRNVLRVVNCLFLF